jgi:hypothetical protein
MEKVMRLGTMEIYEEQHADIFIKATIKEDGELSISGVIGPKQNGDCTGSCGQIVMGFKHRNTVDDDKRYHKLTTPEEIDFAPGWNKDKWLDLLDVWEKWHLNHMRAGCEHQREMGWTYEEHHDKKTFKGELCPVCGYSIGSKWLKEELPAEVVEFIKGLPDSDAVPAWI